MFDMTDFSMANMVCPAASNECQAADLVSRIMAP